MLSSRAFKKNLKYLIAASRGGAMRARIISELMEKPQNPNQLSETLGVDYKTIRHHLEVMLRYNWVSNKADKYGDLYMLTFTDEEKQAFDEIMGRIGKKL